MTKMIKKKKKNIPIELLWKVDTVQLLREMVENNDKMGILKQPVNIFGRILARLAERCIEINDDELNGHMAALTLYDFTNEDGTRDTRKQSETVEKGIKAREKRLKAEAKNK